MQAILMTKKGSVEVLELTDISEPEITRPTQVKIQIKAASVNPIDTKVRRNGTFYPDPLPTVLGCDGAGVIVSIGDEVVEYNVGDEVWFCHGGLGREQGNYAEFTVIDKRWVSLKPQNISFVEAAAMPLVLITAWNALFHKGDLRKGQTVLIHAGAGGVGHVAIQLAKLKGATVITTVSSEEKALFCKSLGADNTINYVETNFVDEVNRLTDNQGVDLVIDTVGENVFTESILATAFFGRVVTLLDPGRQNLATARMKNLLISFELMLTPILKELDVVRDQHLAILKQCAQMIENDELKGHVSKVFPIVQAGKAHYEIEKGHSIGKIVLKL